jgi:fructose-1,6-bisphosphatase/inositol monophosphatase family enzyme
VDDPALLDVLREAARAVRRALDDLSDWGPSGARPDQYASDVVADAAVLSVLDAAGLAVLSEETGLHGDGRDVVVVVDPVDGSTNAAAGVPWFATSLCAVDADGPRVAVVQDHASGVRFEAVRGGGAWRDGAPVQPSDRRRLEGAFLAVTGWPPQHLGWSQFRSLGALALDLCAVASGVFDAYVDFSHDGHGPWDWLAGMLVCSEAGAGVADAFGRELVVVDHAARRTLVAGATRDVLEEALAARRSVA